MNKWCKRFYDAHQLARKESACMKVAVGAMFIPQTETKKVKYNAIFASNSNPDGYSCQEHGECYKAAVTGIYESCEETRPYCKSVHAEINLIDKMKARFPEKDPTELLSDGEVWVTRYPCENCAMTMIQHGLKVLRYCGVQPVSDEVSELLSMAGVDVQHFSEYDFENAENYPWWTHKFYDEAYEITEDRRAPLTIISYNRPDVPSLKALGYHIDHIDKYPCIIFVRDSQKQMYEESVGHYPEVAVVSFPDDIINNAGATRRESQKWLYNHGYNIAFQIDDDIESLGVAIKDKQKNGYDKSGYWNGDFGRIFSMWQIAMEKMIAGTNGKMMISGGMPVAFSFKSEYCTTEWSSVISFGAMTQLVCWNVKGMVENNLFYRDNADVGLDDIDMTLNVLESGNLVCGFPWLVYGCEPMGRPEQYIDGDFKRPGPQLIERFRINQEKLAANHGHLWWLKFREKRRLPQTCINWLGERKWAIENGYMPNVDVKNDIWQDGKLLEEARSMNYAKFEGY